MKNIRTLLIVIPAAIVVAAIVGFIITFSVSSQAALARLCIDVGVLIALAYLLWSFEAPKAPRTHYIVDGLRDLARGRYDRRLTPAQMEDLPDVGQAFNELAGTLSDTYDPAVDPIRHAKKPDDATYQHSHHPELGPIERARQELQKEAAQSAASPLKHAQDNLSEHGAEVLSEIQQANSMLPQEALSEPPTATDLLFLFERFKAAHDLDKQASLSFSTFQETIENAKADLMAAHHCRDVEFVIVRDGGQVALRPKLIR